LVLQLVERPAVLDTGIRGPPAPPPKLETTGQPGGDRALRSHEAKWDGWRALVHVDGGLRVRTRTGRQVADSLPELTGLVDALHGSTKEMMG
jgi:ATP-dependent DNA ligase